MWVFTIAHDRVQLASNRTVGRSLFIDCFGKPVGNGCIISGSARECLGCELFTERNRERSFVLFELGYNVRIVSRIDNGCHIGMVLCRSADHGRPTNVDIFNSSVVVAALEADFFKRIKIDDGKIDTANAVCFHGCDMFRIVAHCKQAAVH